MIGDRLFAAGNGTNVTYSAKDQYIRIPCGVSHPKASATLCRKDNDVICLKIPTDKRLLFVTSHNFHIRRTSLIVR